MATRKQKKRKVVWYAKGGGIARCGPYKTQMDAAKAMRLAKPIPRYGMPTTFNEFPDDVFVWPEEV